MEWYWILLIVLVVLIGLIALYYGVTGSAEIVAELDKSALKSLAKLEFSDLKNSPDNQSKIQSILKLSVPDPVEGSFYRDIETQLNKETTVPSGASGKYYGKLTAAITASKAKKMNIVSALLYFYARTAFLCFHNNAPNMSDQASFASDFNSFVVKAQFLILLKDLMVECQKKLGQPLPAVEKLVNLVRSYLQEIANSIKTASLGSSQKETVIHIRSI